MLFDKSAQILGLGMVGAQFQHPPIICRRFFHFALLFIGHATIGIGLGILGIELDGSVVVGNRAVKIAFGLACQTTVNSTWLDYSGVGRH